MTESETPDRHDDPDAFVDHVTDQVAENLADEMAEDGVTRDDIRKMVIESMQSRLLNASETALRKVQGANTIEEVYERLGITRAEWHRLFVSAMDLFGLENDKATKRMKRVAHHALLLGLLIGIEFEEPGGLERPPAERAVMRRRRHTSRPTGPGRRDR